MPASNGLTHAADTTSPSRRDSLDSPRVPSRSPHPYHRRRVIDGFTRIRPDLASKSREEPVVRASSRKSSSTSLNRRKSRDEDGGSTPSESGTEADDEAGAHVRMLPAPPLRPRKGLKSGMGVAISFDGTSTPLLTPSAIDDEGRRFRFRFGEEGEGQRGRKRVEEVEDEETRRARARFVKRRRAELGRRASEVLLLVVLGLLVFGNAAVRASMARWYRVELMSYIAIVTTLYLLYPVRLTMYSWKRTRSWKPVPRTISLPAAFDPAPILYPQFLPVMIALVLLPAHPKVLQPTLVLGLASVPAGLYRFGNWDIEPLRWLVSILPLAASNNVDFLHTNSATKPHRIKLTPPTGLHTETIAVLYPLHQTLVLLLHYLTSTSLLPAEVQLLSIGLIELLLCTEMPHTMILQVILCVGGLGLLILCGPPIRWNIALARIPRWRLRRAGRLVQAKQAFLASLNQAMPRSRSVGGRLVPDSDADDDEQVYTPPRRPALLTLAGMKQELFGARRTYSFPVSIATDAKAPKSAVEASFAQATEITGNGFPARPRSYTMPVTAGHSVAQSDESAPRRRRNQRSDGRSFLSLTRGGAAVRKWLYALYTYLIMMLLVFGPVRTLIARYALNGNEPFGWAIGYLFGDLPQVRFLLQQYGLDSWAALPPPHDPFAASHVTQLGRAERARHILGEANTRLLLCGWCIAILLSGLLVVLSFTFVEVDTRRKVFHGMMVAMLLPTIFVDPAFVSLALTIMLALFLLLDLLRASQLPPLSKPIASFLTPYVDGRDLRGPVVVSHIFLLVGCAVPLWLALAGMPFSGREPWQNWDLQARDISMVSGVVCVGMGDAAASLIGRRYGRRKWPWTGGKSLEGSAAFAAAVTTGLLAAKLWLRLGQWEEVSRGAADAWASTAVKALAAAAGASFMEAVLTGGNDNVVVPVGLWLFVRALEV